ncbi:ThuA domain-containing protein [Phnomibacter sp. MR]|uniref:ThuA domain-containing protein n=1 Tax=Phnomibacter sp. MR TaxID=3042318 RepID=UPI003A7F76D9
MSLLRFLFVSFLLLAVSAQAQSLKGKRILVFSKTAGFRHASIAQGKQLFLQIAASEKCKVDTTEDAGIFTAEKLQPYDVVVFLSTTGDVLNAAQQAAFQEYIRSGKSFLGIHGASDTEYDWPWYNQLVGGYFKDHPKPQTASYINLDSTHPATKFWPSVFSRFEEIYNIKALQKDKLKFLLAVDETSYEGGNMDGFHPAAWCHVFEGGRAFYTALGHHPETYSDPDFRKHILGALHWLLQP